LGAKSTAQAENVIQTRRRAAAAGAPEENVIQKRHRAAAGEENLINRARDSRRKGVRQRGTPGAAEPSANGRTRLSPGPPVA
jgi:hypothetical protein